MIDNKQMTKKKIEQKKKNQRGASLVEYALLVALIAAAAVGGIRLIGTNAQTTLNNVATDIAN